MFVVIQRWAVLQLAQFKLKVTPQNASSLVEHAEFDSLMLPCLERASASAPATSDRRN
jgi:hypothetical protein